MKVDGAVALVLGGARGLGLAYVEALLKKGAKVCLGDVLDTEGYSSEARLQNEFGTSTLFYKHCDVVSEDQIDALLKETIDRYGKIDIVINSAGICSEKEWNSTLDINLGGAIRSTNLALKYMSKLNGGRGGVVIQTSSALGVNPCLHSPLYGATKAGIIALCRSHALPEHFERTRVRFNVICPPMMPTKINWEACKEGNIYFAQETRQRCEKQIVDKQYVEPSDCAQSMITAVEDEALNGKVVMVTVHSGILFHEPPLYTDI